MKQTSMNIFKRAVNSAMKNNYTFKFFGNISDLKYRSRFYCKCDICSHEWQTNVENLICSDSGCKKCKGKLKHDTLEMNLRIYKKADEQNLQLINFEGYKSLTQYIEYHCNVCDNTDKSITQLFLSKNVVCNCCNNIKKYEYEIKHILQDNGYTVLQNQKMINNPDKNNKRKLELDLYIPEYKVAIEYNDKKSHTDIKYKSLKLAKYFNSIDEYHEYKSKQCELMGIKLFHVFEEDYKQNKEQILNQILFFLKSKDKLC